LPLFHLPILGGWRNYVVLKPLDPNTEWHPIWVAKDVVGISQLTIKGAARLLLGPEPCRFYGVSTSGDQIKIIVVGFGRIGARGPFARLPLL